jgi:hypothetical protein
MLIDNTLLSMFAPLWLFFLLLCINTHIKVYKRVFYYIIVDIYAIIIGQLNKVEEIYVKTINAGNENILLRKMKYQYNVFFCILAERR